MSDASPNALVYIAYARADRVRVEPIVAALRQRGVHVAFDTARTHGGGAYVHESQRTLRDASALVVFHSAASAQSPWVESETRAFQSLMARGGGRTLIPVRLDELPLPLALTPYALIDGANATPAMLAATLSSRLGAAPEREAEAPADLPAAASSEALVYIAYARTDRVRVEPVVAALRERGVSAYFDADRAHGGGAYVHESQRTLRDASALVVFCSHAAARSPWVESEIWAFQSLMARDGHRQLIPVRLDDTPLPLSLTPYAAIDGAAAPAWAADAIMRAIGVSQPGAPADGATAEPPTVEGTQWEAEEQAREPESGAAAPAQPVIEAAPAPSAPAPEGQDDTVKAPAIAGDRGLPPFLGEFDPFATEREVYGSDAESEPGDNSLESAAEEPLASSESDFGSVRGGWAPPSDPGYAPVAPAAPPPPPRPQPITQPRESAASASAPRPKGGVATQPKGSGASPQTASLEQATFTAYHPREMQLQQWQPLVVYLSLDNPATLALVAASAAERLAGKLDQFRPGRADKPAGLARGAHLRIVPSAPGFQFNPSYLDVTWQEDVQQHEFRMRAESAQPGSAVNGVVQFYQGLLLRAEVPISVFVGQAAARLDSPDAYAQAIARAYRRIFASYSHQDMPVVESCENVARTMGDQYLRDVSLLQSGQQWDPRLIQAINDADIFQLFWSKRASTSPFVEREWRHALHLLPARPNFIRPVYWSRQLYSTPAELNALHFQQLSLASLGWGRLRTMLYEWRNG